MTDNTTQEQKQIHDPELKDKVVEAIKEVYDPEIPVDVYEISIYPMNIVHVLMTLTSPACPSAEAIPEEVDQRIREIPEVSDVQVEITWDPPYSPDMLSEAAKLELGFL